MARFFSTNHDSLLRMGPMKLLDFESIVDDVKWLFFVQDEGGAKGRLSRYVEIF